MDSSLHGGRISLCGALVEFALEGLLAVSFRRSRPRMSLVMGFPEPEGSLQNITKIECEDGRPRWM